MSATDDVIVHVEDALHEALTMLGVGPDEIDNMTRETNGHAVARIAVAAVHDWFVSEQAMLT
jgi:hypothetical protein